MAEALPPDEIGCVECDKVCVGERITLDCSEHHVCMKCLPKRAERLGSDVASCVACRNSRARALSRDTSPVDVKDNVSIFVNDSHLWIEGKKARKFTREPPFAQMPAQVQDNGEGAVPNRRGERVHSGLMQHVCDRYPNTCNLCAFNYWI